MSFFLPCNSGSDIQSYGFQPQHLLLYLGFVGDNIYWVLIIEAQAAYVLQVR